MVLTRTKQLFQEAESGCRREGGHGLGQRAPLMAVGCLSCRLLLDKNQPGVVDAQPGQRIQLTCRAEGFPPPAIEWQRDGQPLSSPRFVCSSSLTPPVPPPAPHPVQALGGGAARHHLWSVLSRIPVALEMLLLGIVLLGRPVFGSLSLSRVVSGDRRNGPARNR